MIVTLGETVWRVEEPKPLKWGGRTRAVAHGVRNGHTLCGLTEWTLAWADGDTDAPRCSLCNRVPEGFATAQDLISLGITYRQLQNWCSQGFLRAVDNNPGSGARRLFNSAELDIAYKMIPMVKAGIPPRIARKAALNDGKISDDVAVVII